MTSGDGTTGATRLCKNPACGKSFRVGLVMRERQAARYCTILCREQAQTARQTERERQARESAAVREPIACTICGKPFVPRNKTYKTCSEPCLEEARLQHSRARNDAQRTRLDASKATPPRPAPTVCADCGKPARRDTDSRNLVYCTYRCGWSVLLTAKDRDVRADTADPTPDPEEDVSEEDLDTEETEEEEAPASVPTPAPTPPILVKRKLDAGVAAEGPAPAPKVKQRATEASCDLVLHAIRCGQHDPIKIMDALKMGRTSVFRALDALCQKGAIVRHRGGQHAAYYLPGEPLPVAPTPAPRKRRGNGLRLRVRQETEEATLDAIRAGATSASAILERVGKHPSSVYLAINRLVEEGKVVRGGKGNCRVYTLAGVEPPAPVAHEPALVRKPDVSPAPASLRAQIAALSLGELLALLADLEPVGQHARALCAALAGLREAR